MSQSWIDWIGSDEPDLVKHVTLHCRDVGLDDFDSPFQPQAFHDFMIVLRENRKFITW